MIRLGLCCIFLDAPIKYRATTAKALGTLKRAEQLAKVSGLCLHNAESLVASIEQVHSLGLHSFRMLSPIFPRYTHPDVGYELDDVPDAKAIKRALARVKRQAKQYDIRLSLHPDQFVVLNSLRDEVIDKSIAELEYQAILAKATGAEVINIHGGGAFGDKAASLDRFREHYPRLSKAARDRLTLENDDVTYTVKDLLPVCEDLRIPLIYDVHHHRCNPDGLSVQEATDHAIATWDAVGKEPYFHISSPKAGWKGNDPKPHADYIDLADFPEEWRDLDCTVDVEAKAKERAVLQLRDALREQGLDV